MAHEDLNQGKRILKSQFIFIVRLLNLMSSEWDFQMKSVSGSVDLNIFDGLTQVWLEKLCRDDKGSFINDVQYLGKEGGLRLCDTSMQ